MKKFLFLIYIFLFSGCNYEVKQTSIVASSYIVIEQSTNKILQGANYDIQRSVASISKIMSAIIAIENNDLEKIVIVPSEINEVYGSSMYLKVNQEISIKDLLYGLLLRSGNDAAITLAIATSGSVASFVDLMNEKAEKLNLKNTLFSNPHGLDKDGIGNISTSYDMAIIYSYCMDNEVFKEITSSKTYSNYVNKNKLVRNYQYCTGGKTGFTDKAKRTLVTSASKDGINLIIVTLNCGNDFETHKNLYEYYFNNYQSIKILNKGENIFDGRKINLNKDYYFISDEKELSLFYQINYNKHMIYITLLDKNKRVVDYAEICF